MQYWESHCTTLSKLPSITLLDQGSYPRGLSDSDFVRLLIKLTDLEPWQIWDLRALLDTNSCGFVSAADVVCGMASLFTNCKCCKHPYHDNFHCWHTKLPSIFGVVHRRLQCCAFRTSARARNQSLPALPTPTHPESCLQVGCPEFTLLIVLLSTSTLEQRLQAVYTFKTILYSVFAGA